MCTGNTEIYCLIPYPDCRILKNLKKLKFFRANKATTHTSLKMVYRIYSAQGLHVFFLSHVPVFLNFNFFFHRSTMPAWTITVITNVFPLYRASHPKNMWHVSWESGWCVLVVFFSNTYINTQDQLSRTPPSHDHALAFLLKIIFKITSGIFMMDIVTDNHHYNGYNHHTNDIIVITMT
jgi:hypothetical protein